MTQVLSLTTRDMNDVGASVHRHMSLDTPFRRRGSFDLTPDGRPSPNSFRAGSGRKRASTIQNADANHGMFVPLTTGTSGQVAQDGSRDIICLCTPAPKIPRPRNAFILYRQHHQSQVTVDNPKLSNPEISKIIGEKWKHESEAIKENWKKLAEEEKQRHQHQYPNYRYQPRRGTKTQGSWPTTSPTDEHGRCPKCHGRSIATPRTPSTPFSSSPAGHFTMASQLQPSLPRLDTTGSSPSRRSSYELSPTSSLPPFPHQLHPMRDGEHGDPMSPEMKRRRANGTGGFHAVTGALGAYTIRPPPDLGRTSTGSSSSMGYYPGTTLPDLASLPRSQSGPMPPPLRPSHSSSWSSSDRESFDHRHSGFDESLRLPPLQTSGPPSRSQSPSLDGRYVGIPSTRLNVSPLWNHHCSTSMDAKTTSREPSVTQKLKFLTSISDPPACADTRAPHFDKRGAFIVVEGANPTILEQVGRSLENILVAGGDVALKIWTHDESGDADPSDSSTMECHDFDARSARRAAGSQGAVVEEDLLSAYFKVILSWRRKSRQIEQHVTSRHVGANLNHENEDTDSRIMRAMSIKSLTPQHDEPRPTASSKTPVALVKGGFGLTISDRFASAMPISDKYTPTDHWQWMANFWRGTAAPDLVVYVQESSDGQDDAGIVDVSKNIGLITVKVPRGHNLDEAMERRMGFEVMEWMRERRYQDEAIQNRRPVSF
ncbi:hypothetical protein E4U38_004427 [Claviceps purpurea]|nr:hypothetical protein E4U38_004427 [Claviceps purpurea]KAG6171678.1 hypothetical protein E4U51_008317 [Claviceps purpurea]